MSENMAPTWQIEIDRILESLAAQEPAIYELGTPQLIEAPEAAEIVQLGSRIIPYLLHKTETAPSKVVAYIVMILGKLGDASTSGPLKALQARYQAISRKTEWEFAVIGQCKTAIELLEHAGNKVA